MRISTADLLSENIGDLLSYLEIKRTPAADRLSGALWALVEKGKLRPKHVQELMYAVLAQKTSETI